MRIGVLGGTFDPIHIGHLTVAEEVKTRLDLAEVLFVPAGQPWLKTNSPISSAEHRIGMVRLAIAGRPYFKLSMVEIERTGPSYTVDTMAELQAQLGAGEELFFIMGWDSLAQLPQWREPSRLVTMCHLVAVPRPGYQLPDLEYLEALIPGLSQSLVLLDKPEIDVDATDIRNRVTHGLSISQLVPDSVISYIEQHRLYLK